MAQEAGMVSSNAFVLKDVSLCTNKSIGRRCDKAFQDLRTDTQDAYTDREDLDLIIQRRAYIGIAVNTRIMHLQFDTKILDPRGSIQGDISRA